MNRVLLDGKEFRVDDDLIQRPIQPWKPALRSAGDRQYSDFSEAETVEWHDFRNGIGLQSDIEGQSARNWWGEGVDVSSSRSAVLGPLVTTAGSFGATPVKIIDFMGDTYAIGVSAIKRWDGTDTWDDVGTVTSTTIEDCEDIWNESTHGSITASAETTDKKVGSASCKLLATAAIPAGQILATEKIDPTVDLTGRTYVKLWIKHTVSTLIAGFFQLLLDDTAECDSPVETIDIPAMPGNTWTQVTLPLANAAGCGAIASVGIKATLVGMQDGWSIYMDDIQGVTIGALGNPVDAVVVRDDTAAYLVISDASTAIYSSTGEDASWAVLAGCKGPISPFINKLYSVDIDGKYVRCSPDKNIDGTPWVATFDITEDIGTVYGLFQGKNLADSTPALFVRSNKGLWSLDTTNEIAYRQEVNYPPLTNAGRAGMYWNANIYVSTGGGITKIAPSMATPIGPDMDDGLPSGYQGDVYDMIGVGPWIVYCVNGGTSDKSSIFKRHTNIGGNLQVYTTSAVDKAITCIHHSPSSMYTNGRLWFGEGTDIKYMMFPDTTSNVKQISTYEYVDDSDYFQLPIFRKLAAINKVALGVAAITHSCDANEYVSLYYGLNGAAATTSLGNFATSPRPTILTFGSDLGTEFYRIQFAYKLIRGSTDTNSPELESLMFYWYPVISNLNVWTFRVRCTDRAADYTLDQLEAIRDTATLVKFYSSGDLNKTGYNVKLTNMPLIFHHDDAGGREGFVQVEVREIFKG